MVLASACLRPCLSRRAFIASVAASAAKPNNHPLSVDTLPATLPLSQWLHPALTCPTVDNLHRTTTFDVHYDVGTCNSHHNAQPTQAARLQFKITTAATNSRYNVRMSVVKKMDHLLEQAGLHGVRALYASRWKMVRPTQAAYRLSYELSSCCATPYASRTGSSTTCGLQSARYPI